MTFARTLFAIVGSAVLLGALTAAASAARLSSSSQTLRTALRAVHFNGVFGDITCAVTIEGSFHARTVAKATEALGGFITAANLGACGEGSGTVLRETLPWHVKYRSFAGTLPNISGISGNVIGASARIREPLVTCLLASTAEHPMVITFTRETVTREVTGAEVSGTVATSCGFDGSFDSDRAGVTVLGATTRITITLI